MPNPYQKMPTTAFWRSAVVQLHPLDIRGLWASKFEVAQHHRILTTGSCFAQHIGQELACRGYGWLDSEPAPARLDAEDQRRFGYGILSFRVGNIYTVALLKQWVHWAVGDSSPPEEVWQDGDRVIDPFRPSVEPGGFASTAELLATRQVTLDAMRRAFAQSDLLIFTLGLTEAWINRASGVVYPMCPGTAAGTFDPELHAFDNASYPAIHDDLTAVIDRLSSFNPALRVLLTVSPVPLTATASQDHVLVATTHSKAVLRAVAGHIAGTRPDVDYFPAYELVNAFPFRGQFYEPDLRSVSRHGIDFVMKAFFEGVRGGREMPVSASAAIGQPARGSQKSAADDLLCEETLLDAFQQARR